MQPRGLRIGRICSASVASRTLSLRMNIRCTCCIYLLSYEISERVIIYSGLEKQGVRDIVQRVLVDLAARVTDIEQSRGEVSSSEASYPSDHLARCILQS
jgi:hypothetical protein